MGCVCTDFSASKEPTFECCYISIKFENEGPKISDFTVEENYYTPERKKILPEPVSSPDLSDISDCSTKALRPRRLFQIPKNCIISGELMKYHPGLSVQFVSRWCILTDYEFKYYKNQYSAALEEKPLLSISVSMIQDIQHTIFYVEEKDTKFSKSNNDYQFEIYLKDEDELTKLSRISDQLPLEKEIIVKSAANFINDSVQEGKIMRKPVRMDSETESLYNGAGLERMCWSIREIEWCVAEKRLLFSARNSEDASCWVEEIKKLIKKKSV